MAAVPPLFFRSRVGTLEPLEYFCTPVVLAAATAHFRLWRRSSRLPNFRNYGFKTVNLRWLKDFRFWEKYPLERSAMFNLFHFANVIIGPAGINNLITIYGLGINRKPRTLGLPSPTARHLCA